MQQDPLKRAKVDEDRISIHQTHEINYWTKQLKSNPEKLKRAIAEVGPLVKDVKKWLYNN